MPTTQSKSLVALTHVCGESKYQIYCNLNFCLHIFSSQCVWVLISSFKQVAASIEDAGCDEEKALGWNIKMTSAFVIAMEKIVVKQRSLRIVG